MHRSHLLVVLTLLAALALVLVANLVRQPDDPASTMTPDGITPADIEAHNAAVGEMGKFDFSAAVEAFDPIVEKWPSWRRARLNRGIALLNRSRPDTKDLDRALEIMLAVREEDPQNLTAHHCAGLVLLYRGQIEAALPFFRFVAESDPTDPYSAYFLGDCYRQTDQVQEAIAWFEQARARDPALRSAYHALFQALRWEGREEEAQEMFEVFQKLEGNPQARVAEIKYTRMGRHGMAQTVDLPGAQARPQPSGAIFEDPTLLDISNGAGLTWTANAADASIAAADLDGDGAVDLFFSGVLHGAVPNLVLLRRGERFEAALDHPLASVPGVRAALFGDVDNDGRTDVCLCCAGPDRIFRNTETGWQDQGAEAWVMPADAETSSAPTRDGALVDIDHDGDLDLFLLHADRGFRVWFNQGAGTFAEMPTEAGLVADERPATGLVLGDFDHDRDLDILVLHAQGGHEVFVNDRVWNWRPSPAYAALCATPASSGIACDADADGQEEIYLLSEGGLTRWAPDDAGMWQRSRIAAGAPTQPQPRLGAFDADGDGRIELLTTGRSGVGVLATNGTRLYGDPAQAVPVDLHAVPLYWSAGSGHALVGLSPTGAPLLWRPGPGRYPFAALTLSGLHKDADSMRSNASGIGTRVAARVDSTWSVTSTYRTMAGVGQSLQPLPIGLGDGARLDFVDLLWTDGLLQTEDNLAAGELHALVETQRQTSSCPVLFVWDGERYAFVSDLLGVGGVGFWVAPDTYVPPVPQEAFLLPQGLLHARGGQYTLKIGEPMEEACFLDHVALEIHDLPPGWDVTLDERMHVSGPAPTGAVRFYRERLLPSAAVDARGHDVLARLEKADQNAVDVHDIDRRFIGRTRKEQILTLTFPGALDREGALLVTDGWIEYPYAQTMFAAWQAGATYDAPTIEARAPGGDWTTVLENYGYPAGMPRQSSVPLTGLPKGTTQLRIRSNQEIYWDRIFVAFAAAPDSLVSHEIGLASAKLLESGFALRTTGPQRLPHYDYSRRAPLWNTRHQRGWYTRFGDVQRLLAAADDAVVVMGPGEEVELRFPALADEPAPGWTRHVILRSAGWCKDMDLFTKDGETVGPLPVRAENGEPDPARAELHESFQTRYQSGR